MTVDAAFKRWCADVGIMTPYVAVVGVAARSEQQADAAAAAAASAARAGLCPPSPSGRSVVAASALRRGDLIAAVPDAAVLTVEASCIGAALQAAGLGNAPANAWREGVGLALALQAEAAAGRSSRFGPYVAWLAGALPGLRATHPVLWPAGQRRALLAGTAIARTLGPRAATSAARHAPAALPAACRLAAAVSARLGLPQLKIKLPFEDAYAIVAAYAFTLGGRDRILALVPVWDALDHDPLSSRWVGGGGCGALSHDPDAGVLSMRARRAVPPGSPVFNCYGDVGPARAVLRYGFAPPPAGASPDRLEAGPGEVGVAAAATAPRRRRANAAIAAAAAAAGGRPMWADGESGLPSEGLFEAAAAAAAVVEGGRPSEAGGRRVLGALAARRCTALKRGAVRAAACKAPPGRAALAWAARDGEVSAALALRAWAAGKRKRRKGAG